MSGLYLSRGLFPEAFFRPTVEFLLSEQHSDGAIPWFRDGHLDPWDHVEAAMGLAIGGEHEAAEQAYEWLRQNQLPCGSWWAFYHPEREADDPRRETNFVAYVATGVWHCYRITGHRAFLERMWDMVRRAMDFVLTHQTGHGEIHWAIDPDHAPREDALVTGCSSIYKSLECAINIATTLGEWRPDWVQARHRLGQALREKPHRFDRGWEPKTRYSMDWFYPVLTGVLTPAQARQRLQSRWDTFVVEGMGCRCVSDEPWVTVAESCELTLALLAAGDHARAVNVYAWLHQWRHNDGSYWTGYQWVEDLLWPAERPTWTAGAILLAADALTRHTPAADLFTRVDLLPTPEQAEGMDHRQFLEQP